MGRTMKVGSASVECEVSKSETNNKFAEDEVKNWKPTHHNKCVIRALKTFDVSVEHMRKSYISLNGKRIDGVFVNELIDRYGYSDGQMLSRAQLAEKYKLSIKIIEIAEDKLKLILAEPDVLKAYMTYIRDMTEMLKSEAEQKSVIGG